MYKVKYMGLVYLILDTEMPNQKFIFILLLISSLVLPIGCSAKDNLIISAKEEIFTITLPANPTTGFLWSVSDYDKNLFELVEQNYITSNSNLIGAGGNSIFKFKIKKQSKYPNFSIIKFKYSRSWEAKSAIYKDILVQIKI